MTLMHQADEVLEFDLDARTGHVCGVRALGQGDLAPPGVLDGSLRGTPMTPEDALAWHLQWRRISPLRQDLGPILQATGAESPDALAVRARGFSLSDCFWYRLPGDDTTWEGSNLFDNGWDPAFGEAVLARDYPALGAASVSVPDVTCGGISRKAWVADGGSPRMLKSSHGGSGAGAVGEALASLLLSRIMGEGDYVRYRLERIAGTWFSSSAPMVGRDESLLNIGLVGSGGEAVGESRSLLVRSRWLKRCRHAFALLGVEGGDVALSKMGVAATLLMRTDLHVRNYGVVRNSRTGSLRAAPLFDLAGSFMTEAGDKLDLLAGNTQLASVVAQSLLSALDPGWDYSWYDPHALDGFAEELEEGLALCAGWPRGRRAAARALFESQLAYVNAVAAGGGMA